MNSSGKITERHRQRRAVVYVRQSSPGQLDRNTESAARQYALRERAVALGWPAGSVTVVDEDSGRSGASMHGRLGFKELVADVGLGNVGLILGVGGLAVRAFLSGLASADRSVRVDGNVDR